MNKLKSFLKFLPAVLIVFCLFVCVQTQSSWFNKHLVFWFVMLVPMAVMLYLYWRQSEYPRSYNLTVSAPLLIVFSFLVLALVSSFTQHSWFYFLRWKPSDIVSAEKTELIRMLLMTSLLVPFFLSRLRKPQNILIVVFIILQLLCFQRLIQTSGGHALYRTDHPSFMFRLFEFTRCFPQLINYNPYWNGGTEHFVGVTSGTAGPGLLGYPLLRFMPVHVVYTYVFALIFIIFVPWVAFGSIRAIGGDKVSASAAGLMSLGVSQHYFLWMMHYGTIGAALSSSMILPVSALAFRVIKMDKRDKWTGISLILSAFFLLLWPPGAIMGMAVAITLLLNFRDWTWGKWRFLLICGIAVLVLYSQWLWVQLFEGNSVVEYVLKSAKRADPGEFWLNAKSLKSGFLLLVAHIQEGHPALVFFGLAGVMVAAKRSIRNWFAPIIIVLALITGWGEAWKHNSQLARISIPMFFVAIVPASMIIGKLLRMNDIRLALVRAFLVSLLAVGAYNVARIYSNEGNAKYVILDGHVGELVDWIKSSTPSGGRVLFAGKCVHAYGSGNVAYLPALTGHEMMADDYYGFPVGTIEYEYPPRRYRKSWDLMQLFFDTYNVTEVVTYHDKWKKYFAGHPEYFKLEKSYQSYHLTINCYSLNRKSSMLLKGDGIAAAKFNHINVKLNENADEVVLKYNWLNHLKVSNGAEIFPYKADRDITLIGVHPNGAREFRVTYRNIY
jgi:hypothetical protein